MPQVHYNLTGDSKDLEAALDRAGTSLKQLGLEADTASKKVDKVEASGKKTAVSFKDVGAGAATAAKGLAVMAAGTAALVAGVYALSKAATEAINKFDEMGKGDMISQVQRDNVASANKALDTLTDTASLLSVALYSTLGPAIGAIAGRLTELGTGLLNTQHKFETGELSIKSYGAAITSQILKPMITWAKLMVILKDSVGLATEADIAMVKSMEDFQVASDDAGFSTRELTQVEKDAIAASEARGKAEREAAAAITAAITARGTAEEQAKRKQEEALAVQKKWDDAAKAALKAYDSMITALNSLKEIGVAAAEDTLTPTQALTKEYESQLKAVDDLEEAAGDAAEAQGATRTAATKAAAKARIAIEEKYYRDLATLAEESNQTLSELQAELGTDLIDQLAANKTAHEESLAAQDAAWEETTGKAIKNFSMIAEAASQAIGMVLDGFQMVWDAQNERADEEIAAAKKAKKKKEKEYEEALADYEALGARKSGEDRRADAEKVTAARKAVEDEQANIEVLEKKKEDSMRRQFRIGQAAAIAQALIAGALSIVALLPSPSVALAGLGAPALAIGLSAAATGMAVAGIAAQKPPQMHTGGVVDEVQRTLLTGEGVANRTAMGNPEVRQTIEDANKGQSSRRSSSGTQDVYFNDRLLMSLNKRSSRLASGKKRQGVASHYNTRRV